LSVLSCLVSESPRYADSLGYACSLGCDVSSSDGVGFGIFQTSEGMSEGKSDGTSEGILDGTSLA